LESVPKAAETAPVAAEVPPVEETPQNSAAPEKIQEVQKVIEQLPEVQAPVPTEPETKTETQAPQPIENGSETIPIEPEIVTKTESSSVEQVPILEQPHEVEKVVEAPQNVVVADVRFENNDGRFKSKFDF
jgi:hypothetical protein